jgi:hypothetical protein
MYAAFSCISARGCFQDLNSWWISDKNGLKRQITINGKNRISPHWKHKIATILYSIHEKVRCDWVEPPKWNIIPQCFFFIYVMNQQMVLFQTRIKCYHFSTMNVMANLQSLLSKCIDTLQNKSSTNELYFQNMHEGSEVYSSVNCQKIWNMKRLITTRTGHIENNIHMCILFENVSKRKWAI